MNAVAIMKPEQATLPSVGKLAGVRAANHLRMERLPAEDLREETLYLNGFAFPVKLVFRSGLSMVLPVNPDVMRHLQGRLQVRKDFRYRSSVKIDMKQLFDVTVNSTDVEKAEYVKAINASVNEGAIMGMKPITLDYFIDTETIKNADHGVYIPELDIVLTRHVEQDTFHPYSKAGMVLQSHAGIPANAFNYQIEIVDPDDKFGQRFINIAGRVYRINVSRHRKREEGVYLFSVSQEGTSECRFSFEEADTELKLFRTVDEAKVCGDMAEERKRMHEERKLELEQTIHTNKVQMMELTMKHEREKAELQQEQQRIAADLKLANMDRERQKAENDHLRDVVKHHMELEAMRAKDGYEKRSAERKDFTEYLKFLPIAIVGIGIVIAKIAEKAPKSLLLRLIA